ncbi:hypothetical protein, partial [Mycobacterium sp.]|uniref:hypothetical protein n=1 Tax=Mycobacterium sp. TaxID=1785 RepID=UPI003F976813
PGNARRPSDTGRLVIPIRQNQPHKPDGTGSTPYEQAARKIEASHTARFLPTHVDAITEVVPGVVEVW